jgi:uncharacterized protein
MTVLMLRGPQTLAELRTRTQRMAEFADTREVESDLEGLARWEPPLVHRLDRQPGQKEERYIQLLGPPGTTATPSLDPPSAHEPSGTVADHVPTLSPLRSHDGLAAEVAELRDEVVALRRDVDDLRTQLGI